jgi:hypothetical protein
MLATAPMASHAGSVVAQLDAKKFVSATASNVVWVSLQGSHLVGDVADWQPTNNNAVANVSGEMAAPLVFTNAPPNAKARYMMMVVRAAPTIKARATLTEGEVVFRVDGTLVNGLENDTSVEIDQGDFCETASWRVNGVEDAPMLAGQTQIVEADYGKSLFLRRIALGGTWGRREWERGWRGEFLEVIFWDTVPGDGVLLTARRYLDYKHGLNLDMPRPDMHQVNAAMATGLHTANLFSTIFMIR